MSKMYVIDKPDGLTCWYLFDRLPEGEGAEILRVSPWLDDIFTFIKDREKDVEAL